VSFLRRLRGSRPDPDEILDGVLLVATPDSGGREPGTRMLEQDEDFEFVLVSDDEGRTVLPAFTSEDALRRWQPQESSYVGLPGRVLVELLAESDWDRIVVDGADATAFEIPRSAARELLGVATHTMPAGTTLLVGQPATPPPAGLTETLRRACEREPRIVSAYLFQMAILESDEDPRLAVGLELDRLLDEAEAATLVQAVGDAVEPAQWGYDFLDFHLLAGEMLEQVASATPAVYRR
jgi:SseB protein N-terminal domain/SseB protein C-terminal domain